MKVLVLGGTRFLGREIVATLLAAGHEVSVFNRGITADALPASVQRLRGDRDQGAAGLAALAGRAWDACVDLSGYTPRQVRASAQCLRGAVGRYVFVSAVMVYGDPPQGPVDEAHPRLPPAAEHVTEVDGDTYGALKVACEDIVSGLYGARCTLLRPQTVVGPYDPMGRCSFWTRRAGEDGEMLAPGDGTDHVQFIDVRDLARFARTVIEADLGGAFNLGGPRLTWTGFVALLGAKSFVWVGDHILRDAGLTFMELPLYRRDGGPRSSLMDVDVRRALQAGLTLTTTALTLRSVREGSTGFELASAISRSREAGLIALARRRAA